MSAFLDDIFARGELPSWVQQPGASAYFCPLCGNTVRELFSPICTGPHPSLDEHEPLIMEKATLN